MLPGLSFNQLHCYNNAPDLIHMPFTSLVIHTNYNCVHIQHICPCLSECQLEQTQCLLSHTDSGRKGG